MNTEGMRRTMLQKSGHQYSALLPTKQSGRPKAFVRLQEDNGTDQFFVESRTNLLYTVPEVCRATRLSRAKVYQLIASGELPSITVGRSRRIVATALATWIDEMSLSGMQRLDISSI